MSCLQAHTPLITSTFISEHTKTTSSVEYTCLGDLHYHVFNVWHESPGPKKQSRFSECWACIALFQKKTQLSTSSWCTWAHPEFEICKGAAQLASIHPSFTSGMPVLILSPALTLKSRLYMQALLWTLYYLQHHSIRRHHQALLKTVFPQLPYFCPTFKGLLRAVSSTHFIPVKRDGRTPHLHWKKVHLWNTCIRHSGPALASLGLRLLVHHFKTGLQTAALGHHSPLRTGHLK